MVRRTLALFALLALLVALPGAAFAADGLGKPGVIAELGVNGTSADTYLQYHGRVVIVGIQSVEYRWGGTSCGSRVLTDSLVTMLQRALESGATVQPRYKPGQGSSLCLVGFEIL